MDKRPSTGNGLNLSPGNLQISHDEHGEEKIAAQDFTPEMHHEDAPLSSGRSQSKALNIVENPLTVSIRV